jgi:beta-phosphoglucomutase
VLFHRASGGNELIRAVLFDFDGVLAATAPDHFAAWQVVLQPRNIEPDYLLMRLNEGSPAYCIAQAMARHCGVDLDEPTAKALVAEKNRVFRDIAKTKPYPEIVKILDLCATHGIATAVATGTTKDNLQHIIGDELMHRFCAVVCDGDYLRGKPFPDPFLLAAKRLAAPPEACIVIENAPFGIRAAKAAGMFCVALMTTLGREQFPEADVIIESHYELLKYLETLMLSQ